MAEVKSKEFRQLPREEEESGMTKVFHENEPYRVMTKKYNECGDEDTIELLRAFRTRKGWELVKEVLKKELSEQRMPQSRVMQGRVQERTCKKYYPKKLEED